MINYIDLFILQDKLNTLINQNWRNERTLEDWKIAIFVEIGELIDSLDWKWWKKQENNIDNIKTEVIDIIHFVISAHLNRYGIPDKETINTIYEIVAKTFELVDYPVIKKTKTNRQKAYLVIKRTIDFTQYYGNYQNEEFELKELLEYIYYLIKLFDISEEEVYTIYVSKNVLNIFRQEHGYKEGTYRKIWNGIEDNEVVHQLLKSYQGNYENLPDKLMKDLELFYKNILKNS